MNQPETDSLPVNQDPNPWEVVGMEEAELRAFLDQLVQEALKRRMLKAVAILKEKQASRIGLTVEEYEAWMRLWTNLKLTS